MAVLEKVQEMKAQLQSQIDAYSQIIAELQQPVAPSADQGAMDELKKQVDAKVAECDALRAAIQAHIDDEKTDTAKLEKALAPIEAAPAPVVPEAPAPEASPEAAPSEGQPLDQGGQPEAGAVSLDSPL